MIECFKKRIILEGVEYLVVDLTEPLSVNTQVYPCDPQLIKEVFSDIRKSGCQHHVYKLGDHSFHPHGDAPNHQNIELGDKGFEVFDLKYCFNQACLVDLSNSSESKKINGIEYLVEVKKKHLKHYSKVISKKGAILIRTGYDKWLEANKPHIPDKIPYFDASAADFLSSFKNLKVIGTDSLTVDPLGDHYAHQKLKKRLIVESLIHLYKIPIKHRKNFTLQTSPIRIVGATGGPIVAYAFVKI